ncbi:MAG: transketolase [Bacteroidales bacterium]|nr:transketolase [Bacteroidales bacterium]
MATIAELENIASQVRRDIVRMVNGCSSGHPGGSLGCTDLMTALYFEVLDSKPENFTMEGKGEDMFFLSNGHISPVWYSVLSRRGFFPVSSLSTFRSLGSPLQGHPTPKYKLPGIRVASGSLGQGLSVGIGAALAKKMNGCGHLIYTLHGDGELQEGQIWEGAMFAGGNKLDNLISIIDYNNAQIDGTVDNVLGLGNLKDKFLAFGWEVLEMQGNDMKDCLRGLNEAKGLTKKGKPVVILMHTLMGFGVDFMQGLNTWHGAAPNDEQRDNALSQLKETLGDY